MMKIKPLTLVIIGGVLIYLSIWGYAIAVVNERLLDILTNSLGKALLILILAGFYSALTSKSIDKKLITYLSQFFKNKISSEEKNSLSKGISLIYKKRFEEADKLFKENEIKNYSIYFSSLINIMIEKDIDVAVSYLEALRKENNISDGFGDLFYLLMRGYQRMGIDKSAQFKTLFEKSEKFLFKKMTIQITTERKTQSV